MWNHKLALHIADTSWGEIRRQLTCKTDWYGKELVVIDRFFPSSQTCGCCGYR
ncbi:MAG: zinc ribbon domain-containing protein, partial [Dysosmobacter sp.]|nr:zinc ribbon domain-containing protein [Dysosmobacter sp.]